MVMRMQLARGTCTFTAARLNYKDIFPSNTLLDLDPRLAALELVKKHLGLRYAEVITNSPVLSKHTYPIY
jgi:hypothetical protein